MADRDEKGRYLQGHGQPGPGRDSLYDVSMNDQARKLALLGLTDEEMAEFFGVDQSTLDNWKNEHPAFFGALMDGKKKADADVADSLFKRATGEQVTVEKVVKDKEGNWTAIKYKTYIPGDPGAAKMWLTNRKPDKWRDKREHKHSGEMTYRKIEHEIIDPQDPDS